MKKLITILATFAMLYTIGCTENGNNYITPNDTFIKLDTENVSINPDGGCVDVVVYSNHKWEILGTSEWCTPSVTSGDANENGQVVTFSAELTYDSREAIFLFGCAEEQTQLIVSQKLKEVIIANENNTFSIPAEGGIASLVYQTSVDCEVIIPEDAQHWITISTTNTKSLAEENINLNVAANTTYSARSAIIKVVMKGNEELMAEYTINQEQNDAIIADENNTFTVPGEGGNVTIDYQTNVECEIIISEDAKDWLSLAPATRALEQKSATIQVAENTTYSARSAVVKVVMVGNSSVVAEYTINQEQNDAIIADGDNTFTVPSKGGNVTIEYQTNVECEIIIPEDAKDWLSLAPSTRALVQKSATIKVADNTTYSARSAVVKVVMKGNKKLVAEYTINQEQNDAIIADGDKTFTVGAQENQITIKYKTNVRCEIIIPTDAQEWISIVSANTRALIPESVTLNIAENNSGIERSATVQVIAVDNKKPIAEYIINQNRKYIIQYTSSHGNTITPNTTVGFGANIVSNTYEGGIGLLEFDAPITSIAEKAFQECTCLTSITIPNSVTSIGERAFYDCSSLTSITIPNSVTSIGYRAFYGSTGDLTINCNIPDATSSSYGIFYGSKFNNVTIGDNVTSIGKYAFYGCSSLTSVTISRNVSSIGASAFYGCTGELMVNCNIPNSSSGTFYGSKFTKVTIGEGATTIGSRAFYNCSNLISVSIGNDVSSIGGGAFLGCSSLDSVTIGNGVTSIEEGAFAYCSSLAKVHIFDIATWCKINFEANYANPLSYAHNLYLNGELITDLVIPDNITSIGQRAFDGCSSLVSIIIPNSVTSIGSYAFEDCSSLASVTIPDSVTSIGSHAFEGCSSLASVTIPDSVTSIEGYAFRNCSNLSSVHITDIAAWCAISFGFYPENNPLYYAHNLYIGGELITDLIIPDNVTVIEGYTFCGCESFVSITIPDSVISIGNHAFEDCLNLRSVTINNNLSTIGWNAFSGCSSLENISIPDSVSSISNYAFANCYSLESVNIGTGVSRIEDYTFSNCSNLTSLTIPDSVTSIGNHAFEACSSLASITIPDSVTSIGEKAFKGCSSLTSLSIPDSVTSIGNYAFYECSSLTSATIPDSVTSIGDYAFQGFAGELIVNCNIPNATSGSYGTFANCNFTKVTIGDGVTSIGSHAFRDCSSLVSITIPNSMETIRTDAFSGCSNLAEVHISNIATWCSINFANNSNPLSNAHNLYLNGELLTNLTIPDNVSTIGKNTFYGCSSLTSILIPESVVSIEKNAFAYCSKLTDIIIPESVTSIGDYAFEGCKNLVDVYCKSATPPTLGTYVFYRTETYGSGGFRRVKLGCKIHVPSLSVETYKSTNNWNDYIDDIAGYDF